MFVGKEIRNMSEKWHGGKGDKRRPAQVTKRELELRDALWREKDEKKKAKIRKELEGLR